MANPKWLEEVPCHFIWKLEENTEKDFISIENMLESKKESAEIIGLPTHAPFMLFRAYIYVSGFHGVTKDSSKALLFLDEADDHIKRINDDLQEQESFRVISRAIRVRILSSLSGKQTELEKVTEELRQEWMIVRRSEKFQVFVEATRGFAFARLGPSRYADAEKAYRKATAGCPGNARWLHDFGKAAGRSERWRRGSSSQNKQEEEIDLYRRALAIEPRDDSIRVSLAYELFRRGRDSDLGEAESLFDGVKVMSSHVIQKKAQYLRKQRRIDDMIALVEGGLTRLRKPRAELYMQLVYAHEAKERQAGQGRNLRSASREEQMKYLEQIIALEPSHFTAQKRRADLFGKMGLKVKSKEVYEEMLKNPRILTKERKVWEDSYQKYFS